MRAVSAIRLYATAVFFLVLVGGIVLKPGTARHAQASSDLSPAPPATHVVTAGLAP